MRGDPGAADLVTYWFEKARAQIAAGKPQAAGLVSTNSIRGGANRKVLERIVETTRIFEAWGDEGWVNDAAVRVSLLVQSYERGWDMPPSLTECASAPIHVASHRFNPQTGAEGGLQLALISRDENIGFQRYRATDMNGVHAAQQIINPAP